MTCVLYTIYLGRALPFALAGLSCKNCETLLVARNWDSGLNRHLVGVEDEKRTEDLKFSRGFNSPNPSENLHPSSTPLFQF